MKQRTAGIGKGGGVLLGGILVSFVVFAVFLTPGRALRIAKAASFNLAIDGFFEQGDEEAIPAFALQLPTPAPRSGDSGAGALVHAGITYPFQWKALADAPEGSRRPVSIELALELPAPIAPCLAMRVDAGPIAAGFQQHLLLRCASTVGVDAIWSDVQYVDLGRGEAGIRGLFEWPQGAVPGSGAARPMAVSAPGAIGVWQVPLRWNATAPEHDGAVERVRTLIGVLADTALSSYARHDSLLRMVDVDAFLRYYALLDLFHATDRHHAVLLDTERGRLRPLLMATAPCVGTDITDSTDVLRAMLMEDVAWRYRFEGYQQEAFRILHTDGFYEGEAHRLQRRLTPALRTDRRKVGMATVDDPAEYPVNLGRAREEIRSLRRACMDRWDERAAAMTNTTGNGTDR